MNKPDIQLVVYDTLLECMAAYLECDVSEVEGQEGYWEWADWDGEQHTMSMQDAIKTIFTERKTWGWLEDKSIVHFWHSEDATQKQILKVLAHELGHTHRPYHRDFFKEEQKAEKYAKVASLAFDVMNSIKLL